MFRIELWDNGRWVILGGNYPTREAANDKIAEYRRCDASRKAKSYRII